MASGLIAPAFKEWHVIVEALGAGEQILILRKGGIAEGKGGFAVKNQRFWLFPTVFHAQLDKTKPAAARFFPGTATDPKAVVLSYFAQVEKAVFLTDWERARSLDRFHLWSEDTVRERFDWSKPAGLYALAVRVFRVPTPIRISVTPELAGCKSWIEVPAPLPDSGSAQPVLPDGDFYNLLQQIGL